jgi:hypothetical protein
VSSSELIQVSSTVGLLSADIKLEARVNTVHADISVLKIVLTCTCTIKFKVKNND